MLFVTLKDAYLCQDSWQIVTLRNVAQSYFVKDCLMTWYLNEQGAAQDEVHKF